MRRLLTWAGVSAFIFSTGFSAALLTQRVVGQEPPPPLQLTVSKSVDAGSRRIYLVTIKNVSSRTVRGLSLGRHCDQSGRDIDDRPYADNACYTNPLMDSQVLRPGESVQWSLDAPHFATVESKPLVWVDLVHFGPGVPNWGENKGHKDSYVRE
jgi:hypothetical protein